MVQFCPDGDDGVINGPCMTEPWWPRRNGFIWFLNFILAFVFPIIPWELFFFLPATFYILANRAQKNPEVAKGRMTHLILGISLFLGVYAGGAHPLGLIQAFQSLAGADGICVVHPPPTAIGAVGPPFKLYYGFGPHAWCSLLAIHVIAMCLCGWFFIYLLIKDRKAAKAEGRKGLLKSFMPTSGDVRTLYFRCGLAFLVGGLSQAAPYFAEFGTGYFSSQLASTGGYSKRPFSPAVTENLSAWSWILGGIFFFIKYATTPPFDPIQVSAA